MFPKLFLEIEKEFGVVQRSLEVHERGEEYPVLDTSMQRLSRDWKVSPEKGDVNKIPKNG